MPRVSSLFVKPPDTLSSAPRVAGTLPSYLSRQIPKARRDSQGHEGSSGPDRSFGGRSANTPLSRQPAPPEFAGGARRSLGFSVVRGQLPSPAVRAHVFALFLQMPSSFLLRSSDIPSSSPTGRPSRPDTARLSLWPIPPPVPFPRRQLPGPSIASPSPMPGHQGSLNNTLHPMPSSPGES